MDELTLKLVAFTGITQEQAKKVIEFVDTHPHDFPNLVEKIKLADRLPTGLADKLKL
jgi:hypothetical protein